MNRLVRLLQLLLPSSHTVGYWASVAGIIASGITIYVFWATPSPEDDSQTKQFALSGTGNLGLQFQQQGRPIKVEKVSGNEVWYYTSQIEITRAPVQILVPKQHCERPSDEIMVHAITERDLHQVSEKIAAMRDEGFPFQDLFLGGYATAAEPNFVTDLYAEEIDLGQDNPFLRGWNFFSGTRYSGEADGKLLINVESIGDGENALMASQDIVLVFGRDACGTEDRFWHVDVVGLQFAD